MSKLTIEAKNTPNGASRSMEIEPKSIESTPKDGLSAYEVAVKNGFVGSESAWLLSLKGKDGAPGKDAKTLIQLFTENGYSGTETELVTGLIALLNPVA